MIRALFIGRSMRQFKMNAAVRALIISDGLLWSAWNFVAPIFAVFAVNEISGGSVEAAASGYSIYLVSRVLSELTSGKYLSSEKDGDGRRIRVLIIGMFTVTLAYIGFSFTRSVLVLFLFYSLIGIGVGITTPARLAFFSVHLDKHKESIEWGIRDATVFSGMALAAALGGFIAQQYGFRTLFLVSASVNLLALIPHMLYARQVQKRTS